MGLAIGGCLCNTLQYVAHDLGIRLSSIEVSVTLQFEGELSLATNAGIVIKVDTQDKKSDLEALVERAVATSTVSNSLKRGLSIKVERRS